MDLRGNVSDVIEAMAKNEERSAGLYQAYCGQVSRSESLSGPAWLPTRFFPLPAGYAVCWQDERRVSQHQQGSLQDSAGAGFTAYLERETIIQLRAGGCLH